MFSLAQQHRPRNEREYTVHIEKEDGTIAYRYITASSNLEAGAKFLATDYRPAGVAVDITPHDQHRRYYNEDCRSD